MAHRLPPAGVSTPVSEHYVNYIVIPKPSHGSMSCEAHLGCSSTRTQAPAQCRCRSLSLSQASAQCRCRSLSLSQASAQCSYKCADLSLPRKHTGSLAVECAFRAAKRQPSKCCLTKPCPLCVCSCTRKELDICRPVCCCTAPVCCCSAPKCCCKEENTCAINITLPRSQAVEEKMKKKLKELKTDVERIDEAMECLENKSPEVVQVLQQCVPECCPPSCCCGAKPRRARDLCCVPRVCRKRPVYLNCRPFFGRKKSTFEKLKLT